MAYLNTPRLIFTGDFSANVSTVNNDVTHYNNDTFQANYQQPGINGEPKPTNGWWNPEGTSAFEFKNCKVRKLTFPDGSNLTDRKDDIVLGLSIGGINSKSTGKMTDLDPQMQMCSQLWGVEVNITTADGRSLLQADLLTSGFNDLQIRQYKPATANGQPYGGTWSTILYNIIWGENYEDSIFLKQLREKTEDNKLSFNMNQFGFYKLKAERFGLGRVLGCIGPYLKNEPQMFAPARRLYGIYCFQNKQVIFNYSNCIVEPENKLIHLDLGSSFPITDPMGAIENIWSLTLAVANTSIGLSKSGNHQTINPSQYSEIARLNNVSEPDWLTSTAGIVTFQLNESMLELLANNQILLLAKTNTGLMSLIAREPENGFMLRADNNVIRIDEGEKKESCIHVYQWGKPVTATTVKLTLAAPAKTYFGGNQNVPFTGTPPEALKFPNTVTTDQFGKALVEVSGTDPENPRGYIDGQMYFLNYQIENFPNPDQYVFDQIIVHLRDHFPVPEAPTWDDVKEIWKQFGNLYPIMSKYVVDLGNMAALIQKKDILIFAFTRELNDPIYMPATRDLSAAKLQTMIKWLQNPFPSPPVNNSGSIQSNSINTESELEISIPANSGTQEMGEAKSGFRVPDFNVDLPFGI